MTHWAPGLVRLEMERLLRGREILEDCALRRDFMEKRKASKWTGLAFVSRLSPGEENEKPYLPKLEPASMA